MTASVFQGHIWIITGSSAEYGTTMLVLSPCSVSLQIFHFLSQAYLPEEDYFKGRVKWVGSPSRSDASIQLLNATLTDNGTYSCAVHNPPDVHGQPAQTVLMVTPKSEPARLICLLSPPNLPVCGRLALWLFS